MNIPGAPSSRAPIPSRPAPVQPGEEIGGKYRVGRVLGAGAMGVVVRAWHIELEQEVALKFLHPELAMKVDGAERFRREARAAVRIRSDHVARVLDVGTLEGSHIPFIVMEYLQGRDLARELAARGSLPVDEAARHVLEACDAIGEAHARGIVHRDLKPANLFLAERSGGVQMIKVLDFGISKTLGGGPKGLSITEPATLMGSPGYMSPEQLESSRNVDARTDIWSLGVILQEMVTGCLPFDGDSVPQLIRAVISGNRPLLTEYGPALALLEPVVARCLQQDRAQRFQTIAELKEALLPLASPASSASLARAPRMREPRGVPGSMAPVAPSASAPTVAAPRDEAAAGQPSVEGGGAIGSGSVRVGKVAGGETTGAHGPGRTPDSAWGRTHGIGRAPLGRTLALAAALGAVAAFAFWRGRAALDGLGTRPPGSESSQQEIESAAAALKPPPEPAAAPPILDAESKAPGITDPAPAPSEGSAAVAPAPPKVAVASDPPVQPEPQKPGQPAPAPPSVTQPSRLQPGPGQGASTTLPAQPGPTAPASPTKRDEGGGSLDIANAMEEVVDEERPAEAVPAGPPPDPTAPPGAAAAPRRDAPAGAGGTPADVPSPTPPRARPSNPYEIPEFGGRK